MIKKNMVFYSLPAAGFLALIVIAVAVFPGLRHPWRLVFGEAPPLPPDLASCTRIELQNESTLAAYPFNESEKNIFLTADEEQYLRSLKSIMIEDRERILDLAHEVALAQYEGWRPKPTKVDGPMRIIAYYGSGRRISFMIWGPYLETEDGHVFYNTNFDSVLYRVRPQILPFRLRKDCAHRLNDLQQTWRQIVRARGDAPSPTEWCDLIERYMRERRRPENMIKWAFVCPSAWEGRCDYAMNPECRTDSPSDTVHLFETKAGWNQHGGPELFTFDNHDPRGGLVLLHDGTVRFIRTEEELKQLRWK